MGKTHSQIAFSRFIHLLNNLLKLVKLGELCIGVNLVFTLFAIELQFAGLLDAWKVITIVLFLRVINCFVD